MWGLLPFVVVAGGVFGLTRLADAYAWGNGTTFFIGVLMLAIFVMVVGPLIALPKALKKTGGPERSGGVVNLIDALKASVEEAERSRSVSTREGQRLRYHRTGR